MRVRWLFYFDYEDLKFEKACIYGVPISREQAEHFGLPAQEFEAEVIVGPDEELRGESNLMVVLYQMNYCRKLLTKQPQ